MGDCGEPPRNGVCSGLRLAQHSCSASYGDENGPDENGSNARLVQRIGLVRNLRDCGEAGRQRTFEVKRANTQNLRGCVTKTSNVDYENTDAPPPPLETPQIMTHGFGPVPVLCPLPSAMHEASSPALRSSHAAGRSMPRPTSLAAILEAMSNVGSYGVRTFG
eukprot:2795813-Prymnesium_polylepis.1